MPKSVLKLEGNVFVAGHRGLVGSAIVRHLSSIRGCHLITKPHSELDLRDQRATNEFFTENKIDYVFLAAATVGGIVANNTRPVDFLYDNLMIGANVVRASAETGVKKLLFLGSSCIYPKFAPQPINEDALLTSTLEPTNEAYAIAKIAGLKLCEKYFNQYGKKFISAMPTNLYGPGDNFHPVDSHVIPGMMRRFHEAKTQGSESVTIWGTGMVRREFLHVDDLVEALMILMAKHDSADTVNVGCGNDVSILELANLMKKVTGYQGTILTDTSKPDGTPRKLLSIDKISQLGWKPKVELEEGLHATYQWALEKQVFVDRTVKKAA